MNIYLETIITILALYCVGFNILIVLIKKLDSEQWIIKIKRIYMIFWIIPFNIYIYLVMYLPLEFIIRNIIAGIILHFFMAYMGYKATIE